MTRNDLGPYLRETRESRGLQLDDLVSITRISKNYLAAIEAGQFEKLPNPAYVKGFLRLYAGAVGISGDEVIAIYDRTPVAPKEPEEKPVIVKSSRIKPSGRGRWLLPLVLLILVLVSAIFLQEKEEKKVPTPAPTTKPLPVVPPVAPPPVQSAVSSAVAQPAAPPVPSAEPVPVVPDQKGIFLKLKCNQDSSLNITIDDNLSQHYDLKSGDLIEWKAERSFVLDLGNAGGVEAEFNGKALKPFGASGASAHVVLKADQVQ
jgi:cytoskeletal protein RodZ